MPRLSEDQRDVLRQIAENGDGYGVYVFKHDTKLIEWTKEQLNRMGITYKMGDLDHPTKLNFVLDIDDEEEKE